MLILLHVIGGLGVLGLCGYEWLSPKVRHDGTMRLIRLLIATLVQSSTGWLLAQQMGQFDEVLYCSRGLVYFTIIGLTAWMMYRRSPLQTMIPVHLSLYASACLIYFAPLFGI